MPHRERRHRWKFVILGILITTLGGLSAVHSQVNLVPFATVEDMPGQGVKVVDITHAGDSRLFVVDQAGRIWIVRSDGTQETAPFLDITDRVLAGGEQGLLGLAFHPDYATNGLFYVNYTRDPDGATVVSRFHRVGGAGSNSADAASESVVITIAQPFKIHNAGDLAFGPQGYLWISTGDGGDSGDPSNPSQNPAELLGKMLRLDVDSASPYAVPENNPFIGPDGVRDEIWAFGFRNPFRFSFDRDTGDLWVGDVGEGRLEEVDREPAGSPGGLNYGWRCYEGNHPFNLTGCGPAGDYVFPVHEYSHGTDGGIGRCSIIGGYVYRGSAYAVQIGGHYFFADFCSGNLYSLWPARGGGFNLNSYGVLVPDAFSTSTFGEAVDGELYVGTLTGTIYHLQAALPATLGCRAMPLPGCREPGTRKSSLFIRNDPDESKDKLIWKWRKGQETPKTAFGNPEVFDHALCVYSGTSVFQANIPGEAACPACWKETRSGFKYQAQGPGIQGAILKASDEPGKAKILLKGRGAGLPADLPPIPLTQPVIVQLINSDDQCWEAAYTDPPKKNEKTLFKAKSD